MRDAGLWMSAIAAVIAAVAGWAFGRSDRTIGRITTAVAVCFWLFGWSSLTENCGAGGGCEAYADWPHDIALLVAVGPSVATGLLVSWITKIVVRRRR